MRIIKQGQNNTCGEFYFKCPNCGCEWDINRGEGVKFSPPCMEFFAYMNCPNCGFEVRDR